MMWKTASAFIMAGLYTAIAHSQTQTGDKLCKASASSVEQTGIGCARTLMDADLRSSNPVMVNAESDTAPGAAAPCDEASTASRCAVSVIEAADARSSAYLSPDNAPDGLLILPPPPAKGSARAIADQTLFETTRKLEGSPRWKIATSDVDTGPFDHFACALGIRLTAEIAPVLARLFDRAGTAAIVDPVKHHYRVPRPYVGTSAPICQAKTAHLASNGDYPSGHTANGWMEALILAELAPDRATEILARGRAFGESRMICGAHNQSAVEAGWLAGAAATAVLHSSPDFRADMDAAREELARSRLTAPASDPAVCRTEAAALLSPAY